MKPQPQLIALVGGSGAGKTWLAQALQQAIDLPVTRLSLDDFYRDQSHLTPALRARVNYDHPQAIDWPMAEAVLRGCRAARTVYVPRYSFLTHTRQRTLKMVVPRPIILVDGLWLLWRPQVRRMFDLSIFLHCPARLRLGRRLQRDMADRGRDSRSVRRQFKETVAPMHKRFVAPQAKWADVVLRQPPSQSEVVRFAAIIEDGVHGRISC
jgi:uridine kinase